MGSLGSSFRELVKMTQLLGYTVEKTERGYILHGKKVDYTLMRNQWRPWFLYALNSRGNVCGIKGNYHFSDKDGQLRPVY